VSSDWDVGLSNVELHTDRHCVSTRVRSLFVSNLLPDIEWVTVGDLHVGIILSLGSMSTRSRDDDVEMHEDLKGWRSGVITGHRPEDIDELLG
jgi:hypothetical protein